MKKLQKTRVVVADDHFVVRMGLIGVVDTEPDMEVVGEAADGQQAVEQYSRLKPDLILMDLRMPLKSGIEATIDIRREHPEARVLMLTTFDGDDDIYRALQAGAQGYVLKSATGAALVPALRAVAAGEKWIPDEVKARLSAREMFQELTPREVQVLQHLAKGLANKEIADLLNISDHTAKDHISSIISKLRVVDRTEAVTTGLQRGIIHL
jgi:DNA-binding NarL/FixJ family response regulator